MPRPTHPKLLSPWLAAATLALALSLMAGGCDAGGGVGAGEGGAFAGAGAVQGAPSNRARFTFDCDLQGAVGQLTVDVEVVQSAGAVWGPGPNPQITGVIGDQGAIYYTAGELRSDVAYYTFTGENQFADFVEPATYQRFRVQWILQGESLVMVINPFGEGPAYHMCQMTGSQYL